MMRVLFTTLRNTGHFLPLVPFVEACLRGGHEVAVSAPEDLRERATAVGATFLPFGHPGDAGLGPLWARMRDAADEDRTALAVREVFAGACAGAALPELLRTVAQFRPHLIVRESQEYAAVVAAEKCCVHHVRVSITARRSEALLFGYAASSIDQHRAGVGLPLDPEAKALRREPVLSLFPECLDPVDEDGARTRRFRAPRPAPKPLPEWWPREVTGPFVYATLGSVVGGMDAMRHHFKALLEALSPVKARVLLTVGSGLPEGSLGEVPNNIRVERFVPQDEILPHAAACVCHGGSGTVLGTLAAGVPMVVTPFFADQPMNAARVAELGAGIALPPGKVEPRALTEAVERVLSEPSFRATAKQVQEAMAALPAVDEVAKELESTRAMSF